MAISDIFVKDNANSWINILQCVYPVDSIYFSNNSTSPADIIGGTWSQIKNGLIAAAGSLNIAALGAAGGSNTISVSQMPSHNHIRNTQTWIAYIGPSSSARNGGTTTGGTNLTWGSGITDSILTGISTGGGKPSFLHIIHSMFGKEQLKTSLNWGGAVA